MHLLILSADFTSVSEPESENSLCLIVLGRSSSVVGGVSGDLGKLILPFGFLTAFLKLPIIGLTFFLGAWMASICFMMLPRSVFLGGAFTLRMRFNT